MLFHVMAFDRVDGLSIRKANRDAHLSWIRETGGRVRLAGPMLGEDDQTMIGSILLIEAQDRDDLREFLSDDPYSKAGLFDRVEITPFKWVIGAPE